MTFVQLCVVFVAFIIAFVLGGGPSVSTNCDLICAKDYNPLCASDGENLMTFENLCELERYNCIKNLDFVKYYDGECKSKSCATVCTKNFQYICARKNGKDYTFTSQCIFDRLNCRAKGAYEVLYREKCKVST